MIELKLTVTDIPKDKIYVGAKGSYLTININKMQQPDAYGNDYTAYIYDKDTKQKIYIGKGKGKFEDAAPTQQPQTNTTYGNGAKPEDFYKDVPNGIKDDLPF